MAWVQISEEEAKNHPYWDKFCWVRWLFIIMGMLKAGLLVPITILTLMDMRLYSKVGTLMSSSFLLLLILWTTVILMFGFKRQYNKHLPFLILVYIPISMYLIMPLWVLFGIDDTISADEIMIISSMLFVYLVLFCIYKLIAENSEVFRLQYMKQIKVTQYYNNYYK
ncbi:hypothetical protein D6D94_08405 [Moraxella catarrhalis]|uniref:Putative membrane protein n=1 Tax=Moraxella catarrhalis TaxID=480 RepID=A0A3S9QEX8_MORCA|nr:hypothetical protein [Moraxella catarrhalis]AZQ93244.1 putative membrane protein [Moraxella catarrhalis]MPW72297.1 hypothetical protein [Moraxella catarrhalis]MPW80181.1 hypothetical protein [Moraxella catarrhalis]MPW80668.1 hypothetical protein [Moraxella catarrhalis]MPX04727.1 hypothetical protein [Moraxella catarrhalis]